MQALKGRWMNVVIKYQDDINFNYFHSNGGLVSDESICGSSQTIMVVCSNKLGTPVRELRQTNGYLELYHDSVWKPGK